VQVVVDPRLEDILEGSNPKTRARVVEAIQTTAKYFKKRKYNLRVFYDYLDVRTEQVAIKSTCGSFKDCSMCCHQNVNMSMDEFKLLNLKPDSSVVPMDNKDRKAKRVPCPLLVGTKCSQYEKRPIACRMYFTQSSPTLCSTFDMDVVSSKDILIAVSAWRTYAKDRKLKNLEEWLSVPKRKAG